MQFPLIAADGESSGCFVFRFNYHCVNATKIIFFVALFSKLWYNSMSDNKCKAEVKAFFRAGGWLRGLLSVVQQVQDI